ncbi:MAG: hypothetical protein J6S43_01760 [Lentisphaeria bacterium]|nr:hypothetical protein [Lentisphaeria bacterium]
MKKLHFTGIGGAGMAPLAALSLAGNCRVSGSDSTYNDKCRKLAAAGAQISAGHAAENVPSDADMLIYSSAVKFDNCERVRARELHIRELRRGEFLAEFASGYRRCISVTGTHGKSSITSALVSILRQCGKDPGFMIGAEVKDMPAYSGGDGDIFVTEADESDGTHKLLHNFLAVVPNIEDDHEWTLGGREVLENNFRQVAANSRKIVYYASGKCDELFSGHPDAVRLPEIPEKFGKLRGFQAANAFIAFQAAVILGCDPGQAAAAAENYPQVARRMNTVKTTAGFSVVEDYAHHPTEVKAAIGLLRHNWPGTHLRVVFQPHRFARLEKYFDEFAEVLKSADSAYIAPVFAAWSETGKVDSRMLAAAVDNAVALTGTPEQWAETIKAGLPENSVIAVLGAGDIDVLLPLL